MDGRPVWLASVSRRDVLGNIVPTGEWPMAMRNKAERLLKEILRGAGDPSRERLFRMNVTLCLHRGLTEAEEAGLPDWWHAAPAVDLAGGAVEVLRSRGTSGRPAQQPCENPGRELPPSYDPRLWIPVDCAECAPCLDRAAIREGSER